MQDQDKLENMLREYLKTISNNANNVNVVLSDKANFTTGDNSPILDNVTFNKLSTGRSYDFELNTEIDNQSGNRMLENNEFVKDLYHNEEVAHKLVSNNNSTELENVNSLKAELDIYKAKCQAQEVLISTLKETIEQLKLKNNDNNE